MLIPVFGKTLSRLRREKGFSQEKLAELAGYDRTYISLLERGLRQPTLTTIFDLSKSLDIAPHQLIQIVEEGL